MKPKALEVHEDDHSRIEEMPMPSEIVRGEIGLKRAYLRRQKAYKDYKCCECHETILCGAQHVVLRYLHRNDFGYDHHHIHLSCAQDRVLPQMTFAEILPKSYMPAQRPRIITGRGHVERHN